MQGKGKISKSLSIGVVVLVFLLLSVQLIFFCVQLADMYKERGREAEKRVEQQMPPEELPVERTLPVQPSHSANSTKAEKPRKTIEPVKVKEKKFALTPLPPKPEYKPKPKINLNCADSAELVTLYGIGAYFAMRIIELREKLGGFASAEQIMDIKGIDSARFVEIENRIFVDSAAVRRIDLYKMPVDSMIRHPYIGKYAAYGIERYRKMIPRERFSISALVEHGIISAAHGQRLELYVR